MNLVLSYCDHSFGFFFSFDMMVDNIRKHKIWDM